MARPKKYPEELMQRGIRLHIAHDLGMRPGDVA
jgi:hypothetical protein